jgi:hypothetical protein
MKKTLLRILAAFGAVGLAFVLIPTSPASGDDCVPKCKVAQAACDQACDGQKLVCLARCGGPPPIGDQKCIDGCATARTDCGNVCQATEMVCEGKCLLPIK